MLIVLRRGHISAYTEIFLDLVIVAKATIATTRVGLDLGIDYGSSSPTCFNDSSISLSLILSAHFLTDGRPNVTHVT